MALITNGDIITEVLVRNNRTTTDSFITDSTIQGWLKDAHTWASAYKKWPVTEGRVSTTFASEEVSFEGYKADSIRFITVGDKLIQKINFRDYREMKDKTPNATDRVYSDYGKTLFVNTLADVSGTLTAYGQYQPVLDVTDLTAETIFSSWNAEANEAIVDKMSAYLKRRENLHAVAETLDKSAFTKLEQVYAGIAQEQSNYQVRNGDGMFERFDVVRGGFQDEIFKRDQFTQ